LLLSVTACLRQLGQHTKDFPWANLVLLIRPGRVAAVHEIRRAFAPDRRRLSKIVASVMAAFECFDNCHVSLCGVVASRWLPPSTGAPQVARRRPTFAHDLMTDKTVSLTDLLSQPINA
jgi:hypothetical protein